MSNKDLIKRTSSELESTKSIFDARELAIGIPIPEQKGDYYCFARRSNPNCHIIIVDQSGNTKEEAQTMIDLINNFIQEAIYMSSRENGIRDYEYIYLITHHNSSISVLDNGAVSNWADNFIDILEIETQVEMPWGEIIKSTTRKKNWIKPKSSGKPYLNKAFERAFYIAKEHINSFPKCFPPIIYNISNFEQKGSFEELDWINRIKGLSSEHGNVLFSNNFIDLNYKDKYINFCSSRSIFGKFSSFFIKTSRCSLSSITAKYRYNFINVLDNIALNTHSEMDDYFGKKIKQLKYYEQ